MLFGSVVKVRCPRPGEKDAGDHRGQVTACYNLPVENRLSKLGLLIMRSSPQVTQIIKAGRPALVKMVSE